MIETKITLLSDGSVKITGGSPALLFGHTRNQGIYRLRLNPLGEWAGLTLRAFWHLPDDRCTSTLVPKDGLLDVPAEATVRPGSGCITFEGSDGSRTLTSADLPYHVADNSGTEDDSIPPPGTPAWQKFLETLGQKLTTDPMEQRALIRDILEHQRKNIEKVVIYYGYPVGINNAWDVTAAVSVYKKYDLCVFGDTYELPEQEVYAETVEIFRKLREESPSTRLVGYVPIGMLDESGESCLSMDELKRRVQLWKKIGASGIFLDEFGYDYRVTRQRQNEIVQYVHDQKMFVVANSWNQGYVFSSLPMTLDWLDNFEPNPKGLEPALNEDDYSLLENFFYSCERDDATGTVTLKAASCWRVDDGYGYYARTQEEYGQTYYEKFGTKLLQLDAIPHDLSTTEKNTLMTIAILGAKIFNIPAVAFGDEDWGSSGYYYDWDIPTAIDLSEDAYAGLHAVSAQNKGSEEESFPYRWSANVRGNTLSLVFDVNSGEDETWDLETHYVTVNGVRVKNAWQTVYEFGTTVEAAKADTAAAVQAVKQVKEQVENALPTVSSAEERMQKILADAQKQTDEAAKTIESALADVAGVTSGFGFKEVQW